MAQRRNSNQHEVLPRPLTDRYELVKRLGVGAMGVVYLGRHLILNKKVAIKLLHAPSSVDEKVYERFLQEARTAASVRHPNICDVTDFGTDPNGVPYLVMEFLEGSTLQETIDKEAPLSPDRSLSVGIQVASALGAAHAQGIIHRDLKPDNIFLVRRHHQPDFVKILDFGLARVEMTESAGRLTQSGAVLGTPAYMAPEQAQGNRTDQRTDLYSLGAILYEMMSGAPLFQAPTVFKMLMLQITAPAPSLREKAIGIPAKLDEVVGKLLAKAASERYQSAREFLEVVRNIPVALSEHARTTLAEIETLPPPAPRSVFETNNQNYEDSVIAYVKAYAEKADALDAAEDKRVSAAPTPERAPKRQDEATREPGRAQRLPSGARAATRRRRSEPDVNARSIQPSTVALPAVKEVAASKPSPSQPRAEAAQRRPSRAEIAASKPSPSQPRAEAAQRRPSRAELAALNEHADAPVSLPATVMPPPDPRSAEARRKRVAAAQTRALPSIHLLESVSGASGKGLVGRLLFLLCFGLVVGLGVRVAMVGVPEKLSSWDDVAPILGMEPSPKPPPPPPPSEPVVESVESFERRIQQLFFEPDIKRARNDLDSGTPEERAVAVQRLEALREKRSRNMALRVVLAQAHLANGDPNAAVVMVQPVIEASPHFVASEPVLELFEGLFAQPWKRDPEIEAFVESVADDVEVRERLTQAALLGKGDTVADGLAVRQQARGVLKTDGHFDALEAWQQAGITLRTQPLSACEAHTSILHALTNEKGPEILAVLEGFQTDFRVDQCSIDSASGSTKRRALCCDAILVQLRVAIELRREAARDE